MDTQEIVWSIGYECTFKKWRQTGLGPVPCYGLLPDALLLGLMLCRALKYPLLLIPGPKRTQGKGLTGPMALSWTIFL